MRCSGANAAAAAVHAGTKPLEQSAEQHSAESEAEVKAVLKLGFGHGFELASAADCALDLVCGPASAPLSALALDSPVEDSIV